MNPVGLAVTRGFVPTVTGLDLVGLAVTRGFVPTVTGRQDGFVSGRQHEARQLHPDLEAGRKNERVSESGGEGVQIHPKPFLSRRHHGPVEGPYAAGVDSYS